MPKKKDKKGGDKPEKQKKESPEDKAGFDEKEKDLYLTQIRYLNEQLEGYQLKSDELEREKKNLNSQFSDLEKEKKDIVEYLKRSLLEKEDEVDELTQRLESQRQAADNDRDSLQLQHSQQKEELQGRIEELTTKNMTLAAKLAGLEDFQKQKEQLMSNMESLEKQLANEKEEHKADIHSLEMRALLEKRRLEKEIESHVVAMAAQVQHLVDQKVPETTRLAIQENTEVKARFSELSEQARVLMKDNSALQGRKNQLRVDVDILEQMLSQMSRQSCIRKKVVEQLTEKCQQLQAEQKDCRQELKQLQTKHKGILAEMEALRQDRASLFEQCSKNRAEVRRLDAELVEERRRRSRMKSIMQEAVVTLRQALMEAPTEQDLENNLLIQWKKLMKKLLMILDSSSTTQSEQLNEPQTSDPAAASSLTLDPTLSFQFQLARYRPGDLGLVPPPTLKHKNTSSRSGAGSSRATVTLHRKPSGQKTHGSKHLSDSSVTLTK